MLEICSRLKWMCFNVVLLVQQEQEQTHKSNRVKWKEWTWTVQLIWNTFFIFDDFFSLLWLKLKSIAEREKDERWERSFSTY